MTKTMKKAVFFDRDGVLNDIIPDGEKIRSPRSLQEFRIRKGVEKNVAKLKRAGYMVLVITNQPELSRGLVDEATLNDMHNELLRVVPVDEIFVCPHDDYHRCECRKPQPGLIINASKKWDIDLNRSYFIGDTEKDVKASIAANCTPILIDAPYNRHLDVDLRMETVAGAAEYILDLEGGAV